MLARLARELPEGRFAYEPKWDGFRCLAFRDGDDVDLRSRNDRPLARYFPEIVEALLALPEPRVVLDGELVVTVEGRFDFAALMGRLHPAASRVARLRRETPASYVAFDVLAAGDEDLRGQPFAQRRARLEALLTGVAAPLFRSPSTHDAATAAEWLVAPGTNGIDGVVAKPLDGRYEPGRRAMVKVKPERTVDCVVAGFRALADGSGVSSLLLGLYDEAGALRHVGVASSFTREARAALLETLAPFVAPLARHPWEHGFALEGGPMGRLKGAAGRWTPDMTMDWVPLRPELVCEVAYDQLDGRRFRHPSRFVRWRPDRDAPSCRIEQLDAVA